MGGRKCKVCKITRAHFGFNFDGVPILATCSKCAKMVNKTLDELKIPGKWGSYRLYDIINPKCRAEGCTKGANFALTGQKELTRCGDHADRETMETTKYPKCDYIINEAGDMCKKSAGFADPNGSLTKRGKIIKTRCSDHKDASGIEMIETAHPKCIYVDENGMRCDKCRNYGTEEDKTPSWCLEHIPDELKEIAYNVSASMCKGDKCTFQACYLKYQGYCMLCFKKINPDVDMPRNYKTKEKPVTDFMEEMFKKFHLKHTYYIDKIIRSENSSRRRPDMLIKISDTKYIIIEIDEHMHQSYTNITDKYRDMHKDLKYSDLLIIKFNPDAYTNSNNIGIRTCWTTDTDNITFIVNSEFVDNWNKRKNFLWETFDHFRQHIDNITGLQTVELFYNGHNDKNDLKELKLIHYPKK